MSLKIAGGVAIVLFIICVLVVLQDWSKNNLSGRFVGLIFIALFGAAAFWGIRTILGL